MPVHRKVTLQPFVRFFLTVCLYNWMERDAVRVKLLTREITNSQNYGSNPNLLIRVSNSYGTKMYFATLRYDKKATIAFPLNLKD